MSQKHLIVTVQRGSGGTMTEQIFPVPRFENQTVLDVVSHIQQYQDSTLTYRFACRVGMCGSCAMTINGRPRWACRTHVDKVVEDFKLHIGPLKNLPIIKDLAVSMEPFFDKWIKGGGKHQPTRTRLDKIQPVDVQSKPRQAANLGIECINCSICYAACDTVSNNPDYLGPAALQRAWTLYNDEKNKNQDSILEAVSGAGGCHNCHSIGNCTAFCPNGLDPLSAIAGLKRETFKSALKAKKR